MTSVSSEREKEGKEVKKVSLVGRRELFLDARRVCDERNENETNGISLESDWGAASSFGKSVSRVLQAYDELESLHYEKEKRKGGRGSAIR